MKVGLLVFGGMKIETNSDALIAGYREFRLFMTLRSMLPDAMLDASQKSIQSYGN